MPGSSHSLSMTQALGFFGHTAKEVTDLSNDVLVGRILLHHRGVTLSVHGDVADPQFGGDRDETRGHVVQDRRARRDGRSSDRLLLGVDRDRAVSESAATTGRTRVSSSASSTGVAPGRVDSPPTSTTSAPSRKCARPRSMA
jgi:hypothetical protein